MDQYHPAALFRGMVKALDSLRFHGVIWYQGESNVGRAEQYSRLFPAMINGWRRSFGDPKLPFYFVQIAPFGYRGVNSAGLRTAQAAALDLPATGMVVTLDLGDPRDIHPGRKQEIAEALGGLAARRDTLDVRGPGAVFRSCLITEGQVEIRFRQLRGDLVLRDNEPEFELLLTSGAWVAAHPRVEGKRLFLSTPSPGPLLGARYAWSNIPTPILFDESGAPVASFNSRSPFDESRSDDE